MKSKAQQQDIKEEMEAENDVFVPNDLDNSKSWHQCC